MQVIFYTVYDCTDNDEWREASRHRESGIANVEAQKLADRIGSPACVEANVYEIDRGGKRHVETEDGVVWFTPTPESSDAR